MIPDWFALALAATSIFALTTLAEKYIVMRVRDPVAAQIFFMPAHLLVALVLLAGGIIIRPFESALMFFAGMVMGVGNILYNKALLKNDASQVSDLLYLDVIFILIFANLFLGETIALQQYVGVILLAIAATLAAYRRSHGHLYISSVIWVMLFYDILIAAGMIVNKYVVSTMPISSVLFWFAAGTVVGRIPLLFSNHVRRTLGRVMLERPAGLMGIALVDIAVAYAGTYIYFIALAANPVSLVGAVPAIQPFLIIVFATLISLIKPQWIHEDMRIRRLWIKIIAAAILFAGVYLITA